MRPTSRPRSRRRAPPADTSPSLTGATQPIQGKSKWQASWKSSEKQRWDDHRYYHHSRINQSLHLVSAISFLCAYALAFSDPAVAALIGWLIAMPTRQAGHFFFEPKGYDHINEATHEHKEEIKVGYNLQRKVVLLTIWALSPLPLYFDPTLFGIFEPHKTARRVRPPCRR